MKDSLLRKLREEFKYDTDLVAAKLDVTEEYYHEIENGIRRLNILQAAKLGDLYNIDPRHLLEMAESINYNFGSHSRTIYTQHYFEGKEDFGT